MLWRGVALLVLAWGACAEDPPRAVKPPVAPLVPTSPSSSEGIGVVPSEPIHALPRPASSPPLPASSSSSQEIDRQRYPWLADENRQTPPAVSSVEARFTPPPGFTRVHLEPGSFGDWLRGLPLAAPGTPVRSYRGDTVLDAADDRLAAVVAIDIGKSDLQQCADSVIRLHAEWLWSKGARDMSYSAFAGTAMPFTRWARGERLVAAGRALSWVPAESAHSDHATFRRYLDSVFTWANTVSLSQEAKPVAFEAMRPGDFVVMPGAPGHAVLVLDEADSPHGVHALLLGQGYMPAQSFQVLRASPDSVWFIVDDSTKALDTPFWTPFPWEALRRLPKS